MKSPIINNEKQKLTSKRRKSQGGDDIIGVIQGLFKPLAPQLDLLLRERGNPQAPFDDAVSGLEAIFCASIDETKKALDNAGCCAIPFEVDE